MGWEGIDDLPKSLFRLIVISLLLKCPAQSIKGRGFQKIIRVLLDELFITRFGLGIFLHSKLGLGDLELGQFSKGQVLRRIKHLSEAIEGLLIILALIKTP